MNIISDSNDGERFPHLSNWVVWKFGGTSVGSVDRIENVTELIFTQIKDANSFISTNEGDSSDKKKLNPTATSPCIENMMIVVSAMAGVTNSLEECSNKAQLAYYSGYTTPTEHQEFVGQCNQHLQDVFNILTDIRTKHEEVVAELIKKNCFDVVRGEQFFIDLKKDFSLISQILTVISLTGHASESLREIVQGYGEVWCAKIFSGVLSSLCEDHNKKITEDINDCFKINCHYMDAREVLVIAPFEETDQGYDEKSFASVAYRPSESRLANNTISRALSSESKTGDYSNSDRTLLDWKRSGESLILWFMDKKLPLPMKYSTVGDVEYRLTKFEQSCQIVVMTGYVCSRRDGTATTLKRNGSDYSASLISGLLGASELTIWTDVDGIYTADPRRVPDAFRIPFVSYTEAIELAFFGAKVLHPFTMHPCVTHRIPIFLRSSFEPRSPGTLISNSEAQIEKAALSYTRRSGADRALSDFSKMDVSRCKAFTTVGDISLINLEGATMNGICGTASRLFSAVHHARCSVIMITQASSQHSICIAVNTSAAPKAIAAIRTAFYKEIMSDGSMKITVENNCAIVCAVGDRMAGFRGILGRLSCAAANAGVSLKAVAQDCSERNITFVVGCHEATTLLAAMHNSVFGPQSPRLPSRYLPYLEPFFQCKAVMHLCETHFQNLATQVALVPILNDALTAALIPTLTKIQDMLSKEHNWLVIRGCTDGIRSAKAVSSSSPPISYLECSILPGSSKHFTILVDLRYGRNTTCFYCFGSSFRVRVSDRSHLSTETTPKGEHLEELQAMFIKEFLNNTARICIDQNGIRGTNSLQQLAQYIKSGS